MLDFKTPFEVLYSCSPSCDVLKVFGCLCFASVHDSDKFKHRVIRCVFLGYPRGHKGYKLLNLATKQVFISRHVIFHEREFPFLTDTHTPQPKDPHFVQPRLLDNNNNHAINLQKSSVQIPVSPAPVSPLNQSQKSHSQTIHNSFNSSSSSVSPNNDTLINFQSETIHQSFDPGSSFAPPDSDTLINF